jgi:hypothetical protein
MIIQKPLGDLREADLQGLVDERVLEDETLDYKLTMYGQSDADKKEMLRDVSSMANFDGKWRARDSEREWPFLSV